MDIHKFIHEDREHAPCEPFDLHLDCIRRHVISFALKQFFTDLMDSIDNSQHCSHKEHHDAEQDGARIHIIEVLLSMGVELGNVGRTEADELIKSLHAGYAEQYHTPLVSEPFTGDLVDIEAIAAAAWEAPHD